MGPYPLPTVTPLVVIPSGAGLAWSPLLDRLLRHAEEYVWPILPPEPAQDASTVLLIKANTVFLRL